MKTVLPFMVFLVLFLKIVNCLWPPEYSIHLSSNETFIVSDMFDTDDAQDFDDEMDMEMIKPNDLKKHKVSNDESPKYYMLHRMVNRKNRETQKDSVKTSTENILRTKTPESEYPVYEEPAYGQIVDEDNRIIPNKKALYLNEKIRRTVESKTKRNGTDKNDQSDYNYEALKQDYDNLVKKEKTDEQVLKYVNVHEGESPKEAVKNVFTLKTPKNCTKEEMKGIGLNAFRCFLKDATKLKTKRQSRAFFQKLFKMLLIWVIVYLAIAIPCWCTRGWCCCCFRCKYCKPKEIIEESKKFLADNPVGVLHVDGKKVTYTPTIYEKYAQKRLEQVVMKL